MLYPPWEALILPTMHPARTAALPRRLELPLCPTAIPGAASPVGRLAALSLWAARLTGKRRWRLAYGQGELHLDLSGVVTWEEALAAADKALAQPAAPTEETPPVAVALPADGELLPLAPGIGLELSLESSAHWRYHPEALSPAEAERLADLWAAFLGELAAAPPGRALAELSTVNAEERQRLLQLGQGAIKPPPERSLLHALVRDQARRTPTRVALTGGENALDYGELDRQVALLAQKLRSLGVGPEKAVGVCLERRPQLVISLLAVLAAGGVYLPLDPAYPDSRIAFALDDAGAALVIAEKSTLSRLGERNLRCLVLDEEEESPTDAAAVAEWPAELAQPENLAYLIYTSGSTGRAKGVAISHANACEMVAWAHRAFSEEETAVVFAATSVCFDLSVFEIFVPLARGGEVVLAEHDLFDFSHSPHRRRVSLLNTVPSVLGELLRSGPPLPQSVVAVNLAGEPLPGALVGSLHAAGVPWVRNLYGPSEDTTYSTYTLVPRGESQPSIGVAVDNTRAYLLDSELGLCPEGFAGELFLAGAGLSRGYLGRPALTAERYLPDPFAVLPGARMYRTGDLARWRGDGTLAFLGRLDYQVKIRGFRIELGEVEAVLGSAPGVEDVVAAAWRRDETAEAVLVAWVAGSASAAEMRAYLASRLPAHMVPAHLVTLANLPRLPNGKIDRKALPAPAEHRETAYEAPQGEVEERLAELFAEVTGIAEVGRADRLSSLGGHSLMAMRIAARFTALFGIALPRAVLHQASVAELAELAVSGNRRPQEPEPVATGPAPPSPAQERLLYFDRLYPGHPIYNISEGLELEGHLDSAALERAFAALWLRHPALRTTFHSLPNGEVEQQQIAPDAAPRLRTISEDELTAAIEEPYDLARGPLVRALLVPRGENRHLLVLGVHHIVADGWSIELLFLELASLYHQALKTAELPAAALLEASDLPAGFEDPGALARRQHAKLEQPGYRAQLDYWRRQLAGELSILELATDYPRPGVASLFGHTVSGRLDAATTTTLRRLARQHDTTLFGALLAAYSAFLQRMSGQDELIVGTPVAGRDDVRDERMVGFFVNLLPLRLQLSAVSSFSSLMAEVRATLLAALDHTEIPFDRLVEALNVHPDRGRHPLFQTIFAMETSVFPPPQWVDLVTRRERMRSRTAKVDLVVYAEERATGETFLWLEGSRDLFAEATVESLLRRFIAAATMLAGAADRPLAEHDWLSQEDRQQLDVWSTTRPACADALAPAALLAARAAAQPASPALRDAEGELSYSELLAAASRLAHRLRQLGVDREVGVALVLGRSRDFVIGAWASLLAGGYYVPLDPAHPADRLDFMLTQSGAAVLLTRPADAIRLRFGGPVLCPERDAETWAELPPWPPQEPADPDQLAYLIFTSGTTGKPKGVAITQRGLSGLIGWHLGQYPLASGNRCSLVAGLGFDAAVWEMWPPLCAGATLCLPPEALRSDSEGLLNWLAAEKVDHAFLPTPLAEAVLAADSLPAGLCLRELLTGGEALRRRPRPDLPFALYNHYGPTEATVVATSGKVESLGPGLDAARRPLTIGRPIAGTLVRVLDRNLQPVPLGAPGQLYLGGPSLARGYRGLPAQTAAAFVPDPFATAPDARLYATGDRVRFLADGELEFLGRVDRQIKIRGVRIEPGEIEGALLLHPGLHQAVVQVFKGQNGQRLVAFVAAKPGSAVDGEALRHHLAARLPAAMLPEVLVILPALPLTANGKLDRGALIEPPTREAGEAPRTPAEEKVAAIFAELLGVPVGRSDSFFELGGHSLLATKAAARLGQAFGVALGVAELFAAPRVAEMAQSLTRARQIASGESPLRAEPNGEIRGLPLSSSQQRLYFLARLAPESPFYNVPEVLELTGPLDFLALRQALAAVVDRHQALWARFRLVGGVSVQDLDVPPALLPEPVDLSVYPAEEAERRAEAITAEEIVRPFDLTKGPLLRVLLLRLPGERHRLILNVHHLVFDGWSADVLLQDLAVAYRAALAAPSLAAPARLLPPLPLGWADYLRWQQRRQSGPAAETELSFWRQLLAGAPPALELPADYPRPPVQRFRGKIHPLRFAGPAVARLEAIGQAAGATQFMTLLALFEVLLYRLSGEQDLVLGIPFAGRDLPELESQVGFFVNTLALRVDLGGKPSFRALLERVRSAALAAFAHPEVPFDRLVEQVTAQRDLSRSPIFQVIFVCPQPRPQLDLPGLATRQLMVHTGSAKFDLSLFLGKNSTGDGLEGFFEYDSDLFADTTIERFAGNLHQLLEAVAATPDLPISRLPLLQESETAHLRQLAAAAGTTGPADTCLHELLLRQAALNPEALALIDRRQSLSYADMVDRAQGLARLLRRRGVGPEKPVGVCLPRTAELPLALLAVLFAGGAYLPLDPAYPDERLHFMQQDAQALLTITTSDLAPRLAAGPTLCLDRLDSLDSLDADPEPDVAGEATCRPENLAYLIYTSGSTGRAKGVAIEHRQAVALMRWAQQIFSPRELAGTVAATSVCFDLSVFEIFLPLTVGGAVIVVENALDVAASTLGPVTPTLVNTVPSAMAEVLRMGVLPPSVKTVNLAGEALPGVLAAALYGAGVERVFNLYGPSEDTTYSTFELVPRDDPFPSIGVPIRGTTVHVLDGEGMPVPVAVVGELYLGGEGLSRGYLGRPALTAERFLPDPFSTEGGRRLYRTGDRVRRRTDDRLHYLGRTDHQVKIRGFRIEPGEIEAALLAHPQVASTLVAAQQQHGELRLVAWVERRPDAELDDAALAAELRAELGARLPAHMVPAAIAVLARLPRLPNGKIDRKALPEVLAPTANALAPRTPLEKVLAGLWAEALGLPEVGVDDDFFSLGGHSLLAVRLLGRIEEELLLAASPPLAAFFAARTVAGLAELLLRSEDRTRLERSAELLLEVDLLSDEEVVAQLARAAELSKS